MTTWRFINAPAGLRNFLMVHKLIQRPEGHIVILKHRKRGLSHNDFRAMHYHSRRSNHDFRTAFVSVMSAVIPMPSIFGNQTTGIGDESNDAA